ncbi:SDR family NAD(P)-dependent oxidoreductase [Paenirhodobacter hankyongi]|uniref:SDR family oxidoreductase n=1 Tax=Paenirhodobacter hankyongi TaxID=2294033 RepID=A0A421BLM0_9RHOB|nr:SDR family oxidoreductase [Sinirhodobacter hankyongi]RLL63949.1 SDR family oxidoreductase [Sinirhodobacter hankyongi]
MAIALVTGASRGLGRDMALALARAGTDVVLTYLGSAARAEAVAAEIRALGRRAAALQLDVTDSASYGGFAASLAALLPAEFGADRLDALVNNAGVGINAPFAETSEAQLDQMLATHLKPAFLLTQALLGLLGDGSAVVHVSTGLARFALPGYAAYAAAKGGIEVLTRYQAKELGARGIRVNVVAPGAIETDFGGGAVRDDARVNAFIASQTALGRAGRPEDIGPVVAFLCSDAARWVTGQRIEVSGGMFL